MISKTVLVFCFAAASLLLLAGAHAEEHAKGISRRTLLTSTPATPAATKPTAPAPKPTASVLPAGFKKITCNPTPIPGKPYQLNPTGKVCGVWYDEIACQQVDGGSTFPGSPDVCCTPSGNKNDNWPSFNNCIALASPSKTPVKCASTGTWKQKVCCVKQVCTA